MGCMDSEVHTTHLVEFRQQVYQNFNNRADTLMDLLDALCSNVTGQSVVELSLNPAFRRHYSTLFKGIADADMRKSLAQIVAPYLPKPKERKYWLLGVDVTPQQRRFAKTLEDRSYVHQSNPVPGTKPVTIGHQYSTVALLPEKNEENGMSWVLPLVTNRVTTEEDKEMVGAAQIGELLKEPSMPFHGEIVVEVGDTAYSKPAYLDANRHQSNLVTITRVRSNRVFYQQYQPEETEAKSNPVGHPTWYGEKFSLKDATSWHQPDEEISLSHVSRRGKIYTVKIQGWHNMLMTGKNKPVRIPMNEHPFTLVRICFYDQDGNLVFKRPMWLIVVGQRRHELSLLDIYHAYQQRYDLEHFFRFGKQKLLLTSFQTPEVVREETWWLLVHLAYFQLWLARHLVDCLPRPWEQYLPSVKLRRITPALVLRDFARIIRQLGTPAKPPKRRNNSGGRPQGTKLEPRQRHKVVKKG